MTMPATDTPVQWAPMWTRLRELIENAGATIVLISMLAMATGGLLTVILLVTFVSQVTRFAPLVDYSVQQVLNEGPINPGDTIRVTGRKCVDSNVPIDVVGELGWQTLDPRGSIIKVGTGSSTYDPGCTTFQFANTWPAEAIQVTERLFADGFGEVVWHIVGTEWPLRADGSRGEPVTFVTDNFVVVPDAP